MSKAVYFNDAQREVQLMGANTTVVVGGRRLGKSHGIMAPWLLRCIQRMPGCSVGMQGASFKRLLTNTLPGTIQALESWGYKRGVHYVIGVRPPEKYKWGEPKIRPMSYEYVLSFYNGSQVYLLSDDVKGSANSLSLDALGIDEARFINYEKLSTETLPALGSIKTYFGHRPEFQGKMIISDMPVRRKDGWFLKYREEEDPEVTETIRGLVYEIWQWEQKARELQKQGRSMSHSSVSYYKTMHAQLARLRRVAVFYREYSSLYNLEVLGEQYIAQLKRDLPPATFQASVMSQRVNHNKSGFYNNLTARNRYTATDTDALLDMEYDFGRLADVGQSSRYDRDLDTDSPLMIGMDYNANINWLVAGQESGGKLRVVKSFYTKFERKLPELVDDFCRYYERMNRKHVIYFYDSTAIGNNYAVNDRDFKTVVEDCFAEHGWMCESVYLGKQMRHAEKYQLLNDQLSGRGRLFTMINEDQNEDLLIALEMAEAYNGRNGFTKNKSGEKLAETETDLLEHRTDGTDAYDTLCIGAELHPECCSSWL